MSLLTLAQSILQETKSSSIPTSIIGNNEDSAKQVLEVVKISTIELCRSFDWQELQKEKFFTSISATEGYNLPDDFDRFINNTFWNSTKMTALEGAMTPQEWRLLKNSSISGGASCEYFRIRGNQTLIFPIPASSESYVYEYITNKVIQSSLGAAQTSWLADSDVPLIDETILRLDSTWRWLKNNGRPYSEEQRIANLAVAERARINGARKTIRHNYSDSDVRVGYPKLVTP